MKIYKNHLKYEDFIKNELKTLQVLNTMPYIQENFAVLSEMAGITYYTYKGLIKSKRLNNTNYQFSCNFDLTVEGKLKQVTIDSLIYPDFSLATYALSLCQGEAESYELLRKFHFDYATPIAEQEPKPVYHFQYCGKTTPSLEKLKIDIDSLHPWLSVPRLFSTPMNLALLLDMIFTEFKSQKTEGIAERREWREHVKTNEDILLVPYFKLLNQFVHGHHTSTSLLRDFCYGK